MKIEVVPERYESGKVAVFVHHQVRTLDWDFSGGRGLRKGKWAIFKALSQDSKESGRSWVVHKTPRGFHAVGEGPEGLPSGDLGRGFDPLYLRMRGNSFCWRVTPKADGLPAAFGPIARFGSPSQELVMEVEKYLYISKCATTWDLSYQEIGWYYDRLAISWRGDLKWAYGVGGRFKGTIAPPELHFSEINRLRDLAWDLCNR